MIYKFWKLITIYVNVKLCSFAKQLYLTFTFESDSTNNCVFSIFHLNDNALKYL